MPPEEYEGFKEDIRVNGVKRPILVDSEGRIIDGRHRWSACRELGRECRQEQWDGTDAWLDVQSLNLYRRHLGKEQVYAIRKLAAKQYPELAKPIEEEKQAAKNRQGTRADLGRRYYPAGDSWRDVETNEPLRTSRSCDRNVEAAEAIGKRLGISGATVKRVDRVEREAPELLPKVASGELSATKALKQVQNEQHEELLQQHLETPTGRYHTIVIDPPWPMQKIERNVRPKQEGFEYPTMSLDELAHFPLPGLAEDDCHLYLWVTQKFLPAGLDLVGKWGFKYQCLMTWVKNVGFTPFSWMYSTEHVIFARRGNLKLLQLGKRLDFSGKVRQHSRKPNEFYDLVRQVSPGPRIDVFSREQHSDFEQHGLEEDKF